MFNNMTFSEPTISGMSEPPEIKPSMKLLYETAGSRDINNPSAVARVLKASQQTLKNWEYRGISGKGAMKAQAVFGLDSNALLALDAKAESLASFQPRVEPFVPLIVAEEGVRQVIQRANRDHWTTEAIKIMKSLKPPQREGAVATLRTYVDNLGRTPKHQEPAPDSASARAV